MSRNKALILASASFARADMLRNASLKFDAYAADINELAILNDLYQGGVNIVEMAGALAKEKALYIADQYPKALVIGCDQTLDIDGKIISKAGDKSEAREKLIHLRGRSHRLISSVCVVRGHEILWEHSDSAILNMRAFDDVFLDHYMSRAGDALTRSVGAYELESHGSWLFDKVEGDYFTILGMPLLPLLGYLIDNQGFSL